jgi:hypothetical protein
MMVLGHTESRDYAMDWDDIDDNVSLETSSSCPPAASKMQFIHRSIYNPQPEPRVVTNIPMNYQYPTASNYYHSDHHNYDVPPQYHRYYQLEQQEQATTHPPKFIKGKQYYTGASSTLTYDGTNLTDDGRDDHEMMMMASAYNSNMYHCKNEIPKQHQHYLEMEAVSADISNNQKLMDPYIDNNSPDQTQASTNNDPNSIPDPGCFCLGYNMLEYIISSSVSPATKQRHQGRYNHHRHHGNSNNGVLHPVRLPIVREVDGTMAEAAVTAPPTMKVTIIDDEINDSSNCRYRPRTNNHSPNEPDGIYVPPTDKYYSTNSYEGIESI